jgi:hypothetical protein
VVITKQQLRLIDTAAVVIDQPNPEDIDRAYMARQLVQVTLPHANPGDVPVWSRTNGSLTLSIRPGWDHQAKKAMGYPYGTLPRLLLFWLTTEAIRTKNRRLKLGASLSEFVRQVGLDTSTGRGPRGDATRLRDQMDRLFRSVISLTVTNARGKSWSDMQVAPKGELWWDFKSPEQGGLFDSWIELGEDFFNAIMAAPVPVDLRILRALKRSPLALDLYAWATYKTFSVTRLGEDQLIPWAALQRQLGGDYGRERAFREAVRKSLRKIKTLYPGLKITEAAGDDSGLVVAPGTPSVLPRK